MFLTFEQYPCYRQNPIFIDRGVQFYWWRKPEYPEKTTDVPQVTDDIGYDKLTNVNT